MNDIQNLIDRQLGFYCRLNYDNVLKRLMVHEDESFYGLQSASVVGSFDQDPPIFACRFAEAPGYENVLALANEDGRVAIQDTTSARTASKLESFQCHNNAVFDLAWMPGHMKFVTVSGDHTACLWDVREGAPRRTAAFVAHTKSVKTAAFRPLEPAVFATGARDGHVLVWDARAAAPLALALRPDDRLLNCHSSGAAKTPGSHGKRPRLDRHRPVSVTGVVFQDDVTLLSCGECDGNIKVWDLRKNYDVYGREPLPKRSIPYCGSSAKNGYSNLIVDRAGVRLYASCMDDVIYCFNVATYSATPERRYVGHENGTFYIKTSLSPDCRYLVSGSSDRRAYVWSVAGGAPLARLAGHRAEVTCAAWGPDLRLVTCGDDARHMIWRVGGECPRAGEWCARAEAAPRGARAPPLDTTPTRPRARPLDTTPTRPRARPRPPATPAAPAHRHTADNTSRKTKRCLTDLMNATKEVDEAECNVKRMKLDDIEEDKLLGGGKRTHPGEDEGSPAKRSRGEHDPEWSYPPPRAGTSFLTPTKNYEHRSCKIISPKGLKRLSPDTLRALQSPESPNKVRIVSCTTPTKDLPNFVLNGEAPHLRLMSPIKKKQETTDWLTLLREKRGKVDAERSIPAPLSPKENMPTRRNSVEKTPKSNKKRRTLLKYFTVSSKGNK